MTRSIPMMKPILLTRSSLMALVGGTFLSLLASSNTSAQSAAIAPPQTVVRYDDLNLSSDAGTQMLLRRLERAAHQVCGDTGERQPLAQLAVVRQCDTQALEQAITAVNAHKLTLAFRHKYKSEPPVVAIRSAG